MQKRRLGRTELMVSNLGLGGMGVISKVHPDIRSGMAVVERALDLGVNFIDTARGYFDSEKVLGEVMKTRRNEVILASKTFLRSGKAAYKELEQSLETLGVQKIELYQVHHVQYQYELEQVTAPGGALEALELARKEGLIDHIGVTSHHTRVLGQALDTGRFDTVMLPFSPIERDGMHEVYDAAKRHDCGIITMKALAAGRLTSVEESIHFNLAHDISIVVLGCSTVEHVERDVAAVHSFYELSTEERARLGSTADRMDDDFCRRCRYCEPACPAGIPIADVFRIEDYLVLNATYARNEYRALPVNTTACIQCGECETLCPYDLDVTADLKRAHERLSVGRLEDAAVNLLRRMRLYDVARKVYFQMGGNLPDR